VSPQINELRKWIIEQQLGGITPEALHAQVKEGCLSILASFDPNLRLPLAFRDITRSEAHIVTPESLCSYVSLMSQLRQTISMAISDKKHKVTSEVKISHEAQVQSIRGTAMRRREVLSKMGFSVDGVLDLLGLSVLLQASQLSHDALCFIGNNLESLAHLDADMTLLQPERVELTGVLQKIPEMKTHVMQFGHVLPYVPSCSYERVLTHLAHTREGYRHATADPSQLNNLSYFPEKHMMPYRNESLVSQSEALHEQELPGAKRSDGLRSKSYVPAEEVHTRHQNACEIQPATNGTIASFLSSLNLKSSIPLFKAEGFETVQDVLGIQLSDEDLCQLGLKKMHDRKRFEMQIMMLEEENETGRSGTTLKNVMDSSAQSHYQHHERQHQRTLLLGSDGSNGPKANSSMCQQNEACDLKLDSQLVKDTQLKTIEQCLEPAMPKQSISRDAYMSKQELIVLADEKETRPRQIHPKNKQKLPEAKTVQVIPQDIVMKEKEDPLEQMMRRSAETEPMQIELAKNRQEEKERGRRELELHALILERREQDVSHREQQVAAIQSHAPHVEEDQLAEEREREVHELQMRERERELSKRQRRVEEAERRESLRRMISEEKKKTETWRLHRNTSDPMTTLDMPQKGTAYALSSSPLEICHIQEKRNALKEMKQALVSADSSEIERRRVRAMKVRARMQETAKAYEENKNQLKELEGCISREEKQDERIVLSRPQVFPEEHGEASVKHKAPVATASAYDTPPVSPHKAARPPQRKGMFTSDATSVSLMRDTLQVRLRHNIDMANEEAFGTVFSSPFQNSQDNYQKRIQLHPDKQTVQMNQAWRERERYLNEPQSPQELNEQTGEETGEVEPVQANAHSEKGEHHQREELEEVERTDARDSTCESRQGVECTQSTHSTNSTTQRVLRTGRSQIPRARHRHSASLEKKPRKAMGRSPAEETIRIPSLINKSEESEMLPTVNDTKKMEAMEATKVMHMSSADHQSPLSHEKSKAMQLSYAKAREREVEAARMRAEEAKLKADRIQRLAEVNREAKTRLGGRRKEKKETKEKAVSEAAMEHVRLEEENRLQVAEEYRQKVHRWIEGPLSLSRNSFLTVTLTLI